MTDCRGLIQNGVDVLWNIATAASFRAHYGQFKINSIFGRILHGRPRCKDTVANSDRPSASISSHFKEESEKPDKKNDCNLLGPKRMKT